MGSHYRPAATKLTDGQAGEIRSRYSAGGVSQATLGLEFGLSQVAVSKIVRGLTYRPLAEQPSRCVHGHSLADSYVNARGARECNSCRRDRRRAYRDANLPRAQASLRASKRRRKARTRGASATLTAAEWDQIQLDHAHRCHYCGSGGSLEQEHLTPLSRGGAHAVGNVAPACRACNSKKGTKTEAEFARASWACLPGVGAVCLDVALLGRIESAKGSREAMLAILAERE